MLSSTLLIFCKAINFNFIQLKKNINLSNHGNRIVFYLFLTKTTRIHNQYTEWFC